MSCCPKGAAVEEVVLELVALGQAVLVPLEVAWAVVQVGVQVLTGLEGLPGLALLVLPGQLVLPELLVLQPPEHGSVGLDEAEAHLWLRSA